MGSELLRYRFFRASVRENSGSCKSAFLKYMEVRNSIDTIGKKPFDIVAR